MTFQHLLIHKRKKIVKIKYFLHILVLLTGLFLSACVVEDVSGGLASEDGSKNGEDESDFVFQGCLNGQGVGTNTILINFQFPTEASRVRLKRNGNQVAEFSKANIKTSHVDDSSLREGATYLYTCEAFVDGLWAEGTTALQLSTLAVNAPVFPGIDSAVSQSSTEVLVRWTPSVVDLPVSAFKYQVFASLGPVVDWTKPPRAEVLQASLGQVVINGLADELQYSFGVRACSEGNKCETNMVQRSVTTIDGGAPTSPGVTAVVLQNAKLKITAPWIESNGGILRRYIYVKKGLTGGLNIGQYTLERTYQLSGNDLYNPPQELEFVSIQEGETYHIIVQDEDPSGQRSAVTSFQSITVNDLNPPTFGGILNLVAGAPTDTQLIASWTAIDTEITDPLNGGDKYKIFLLTDTNPISANPCALGQEVAELDVANYTPGNLATYNLSGLNERSYYSVCIKAIDSVGNLSFNTNSIQANTKDITAPDFLGIENLAYSNQSASLSVTWNASAANDIKEYKITLWSNQVLPPANPTIIRRPHSTSSTGTLITSGEYLVNNGDQVYATVEACDKTELPFGIQNCSNVGTQRSILLPDIDPPPNFLGIKGPTDLETPVQGEVLVKWNEPADWSDYRGFRVYQVNPSDNSLSLVRTCPCADYGCSDQIKECAVTGLNAYRTYRFHVRAYDDLNNETVYLNPALSYADKRTTDTSAPTFSSNLQIGVSPQFQLTWAAAVDNQFSIEPGAQITYKVYQKNAPFSFANPVQPDGNLKTITSQRSFQDAGFVEGETYYYTVCAQDTSNNVFCDQIQRSIIIPDVTKPTLQFLSSTKTVKSKVWELNWEMQDNLSPSADLFVEIRSLTSQNGDLATLADPIIYSGFGSSVISSGNLASTSQVISLDPLSGAPNNKSKINYLVTIRDQAGNTASQNVTVEYDNGLQISEVKSTSGPLSGGKLLAVYGSGFSKSIENGVGEDSFVSVGGQSCINLVVISSNALYCQIPAATVPGSVEVRIKTKVNNPVSSSNNLFSEAALTNAYTYTNTLNICDNPGAWGSTFASGNGVSDLDPYIICNATHLNNVRTIATSGAYFRLGDHINLQAISFNPIGTPVSKFTGEFDGNGFLIRNWTYNDTQSNVSLFGSVNGNFQIKNLGLVDVNITALQSVAGLIAVADGGSNLSGLISNVFVTGSITANDYVGGLLGRKQGPHTNFNIVDSYFIGSIQVNGITGYGGGIAGFLGADAGGFFQNIYSEGQVNGTKILGGLFGNLGQNKQLLDSYSTANVTATENFAGGIAGEVKLGAIVDNSYAESSVVSGVDSVGGLVGLFEGTMTESHSTATVASTGRRAGGLIGYANGATISNVSSIKDINANNSAGGLIGEMLNSSLTNAFALGDVISNGTDVGGLVGKFSLNASTTRAISKLYSKGFVDTIGSSIGGLIGNIDIQNNAVLNIDQVYSESQVGSDFGLSNQQFGGLIGKVNTQTNSTVTISNCYSTGDVYGGNYVGGLVGGYDTALGFVNINYCYSTSTVFGGTSGRGGLIGQTINSTHNFTNAVWDKTLGTKSFASGSGTFTGSANGYTTVEMLNYSNSVYTNWDFINKWVIPVEGYPQLNF